MRVKRHCIECQGKLLGRSDKKYCNDACRNNYHNRLHQEHGSAIRKVNRVLKKNRSILYNFQLLGNQQVNREELLSKGFDFNYFTQIRSSQSDEKLFIVYDLSYSRINKEVYLIQC